MPKPVPAEFRRYVVGLARKQWQAVANGTGVTTMPGARPNAPQSYPVAPQPLSEHSLHR